MLRFATVTDIHYGFDSGNKKGSCAPRLVDRFIKAANDDRVDFAVDLGDKIIFSDSDRDRYYLKQLRQHFNALAVPRESVQGNHDEWNLTRQETSEILETPIHSRSRDINGFHVIFWSPTVLGWNQKLDVTDEDLAWLKADLESTDKPCILLNHIPLDNDDPLDPLEPTRPHYTFYRRGPEIRRVLEESGKVKLCISGHRHRDVFSHINGIAYITQQSLTQKTPEDDTAHGAFAIYEIDHREIRIRGFGRDQSDRTISLG